MDLAFSPKTCHTDFIVSQHVYQELSSNLVEIFESVRDKLEVSTTNKLWLQYLDMIDIFNINLTAERTGNWEMLLKSLHMMLPFFAAGKNLFILECDKTYEEYYLHVI